MATLDTANPYIGQYDAYAAQAKTAYQNALARIQSQRSQFQRDSGFNSDGSVMADNPMGGYQQLLGSLAQQAEQNDAAGGARGFTGGLAQQQQGYSQRAYDQSLAEFGRGQVDANAQFGQAEYSAGEDYNNSLFNKMQELTQQSIQDQMFNPADYSGLNYPGYGEPTQPNPATPGLPWKPPTQAKPSVFKPKAPKKKNRKKGRR